MLLALVFIVAGVAKLADRAGSRRAVADFGLPAALATPLGILLPLAELAVAAALIPASTAWWGAIGALALLLLFAAGIGGNLARGRKPECHCFGQFHSSPAGWSTLARNGALAAVAGFIVWQGREGAGPGAVGWFGALSTVQLGGLIAGIIVLGMVVAQWWFLVHLLRQNGRLLVRLEALEAGLASGDAALAPSQNGAWGLPIGAPAPDFNLSGLYGETHTLEALRASDKPVMLLFTDPNCGPCTVMLPEIGRWQKEHSEKLTISLISRGDPEENRAKIAEHGVTNVLLQEDQEVAHSYQAPGTPSAVLVLPDGTIGSPMVAGDESIQSLLAHMLEAPAQLPILPAAQEGPCPNCGKVHPHGHAEQAMPVGPKVGEPAPEIKLPDLGGNTLELADFRGEKAFVLFWNPGCGYCQQMLDDLKALENNPPEEVPKILVVSAGPVEANEAMGLRSPVVLDQEFSVGRAFGALGTPSAVLIEAEGKIASEVSVGAPAVLELLGTRQAEA